MTSTNYKMSTWGAIYALLAQRTNITATAMSNISFLPGENFGRYHALAISCMTPDDIDLMGRLVVDLTTDDLKAGPVPPAEQSAFWLAFYQSGGAGGGSKPRHGRPLGGNNIDWADVDWELTNAQIARNKGCSPETVRVRRRKIKENIAKTRT